MVAAWTELPPSGGLPAGSALVDLAERLRWSAPELVVPYARRALADGAAKGGPVGVRAQALAGAALVWLGRHAEAIAPALTALRHAGRAGLLELVPAIRLTLARCARALGEPLLGCDILRPVLEAGDIEPALRAGVITTLVGCTEHVGRRDDLEDLLAEAERLVAADGGLSQDERRLELALLAIQSAAYHRRYGDTEDAVDAARRGLSLLTKLRAPVLEGARASARLSLELVCALLDEGELREAELAAAPVLDTPVRAAAADPVGRLLLAMATRVELPSGRAEQGRALLSDAARIGERHDHDWLQVDAWNAIATLDEQAGHPAGALHALRLARAAEHRQQRGVESAKRQLMIEFGARGLAPDAVNSLLRTVVRADVGPVPVRTGGHDGPVLAEPDPAETDEATGLLTREGLSRRLQAARGGNRPVALTLVRLDPVDAGNTGAAALTRGSAVTGSHPGAPSPDEALTTLAGRVRDIAPVDAELARSDGSELAVLLPHTTRDEAEEFAATIRESAREADWLAESSRHEVSISTGVAQSGPDSTTPGDADSLLTAARETLTTAERAGQPGSALPEGGVRNALADESGPHADDQDRHDAPGPLPGQVGLTRPETGAHRRAHAPPAEAGALYGPEQPVSAQSSPGPGDPAASGPGAPRVRSTQPYAVLEETRSARPGEPRDHPATPEPRSRSVLEHPTLSRSGQDAVLPAPRGGVSHPPPAGGPNEPTGTDPPGAPSHPPLAPTAPADAEAHADHAGTPEPVPVRSGLTHPTLPRGRSGPPERSPAFSPPVAESPVLPRAEPEPVTAPLEPPVLSRAEGEPAPDEAPAPRGLTGQPPGDAEPAGVSDRSPGSRGESEPPRPEREPEHPATAEAEEPERGSPGTPWATTGYDPLADLWGKPGRAGRPVSSEAGGKPPSLRLSELFGSRELYALLDPPTVANIRAVDPVSTVPSVPEPEEVPEPPRKPEVPVPKKPDSIPPHPAGPQVPPEVPEPATIPSDPEDDRPPHTAVSLVPPPGGPVPAGEAGDGAPAATDLPAPELDHQPGAAALRSAGPTGASRVDPAAVLRVEARDQPASRPGSPAAEPSTRLPGPPDEPDSGRGERTTWRRERSDTASIADLLTEALVAYQETEPADDGTADRPGAPAAGSAADDGLAPVSSLDVQAAPGYGPAESEAPTNPRIQAVPARHAGAESGEAHESGSRRASGRHRMPDWDNG